MFTKIWKGWQKTSFIQATSNIGHTKTAICSKCRIAKSSHFRIFFLFIEVLSKIAFHITSMKISFRNQFICIWVLILSQHFSYFDKALFFLNFSETFKLLWLVLLIPCNSRFDRISNLIFELTFIWPYTLQRLFISWTALWLYNARYQMFWLGRPILRCLGSP